MHFAGKPIGRESLFTRSSLISPLYWNSPHSMTQSVGREMLYYFGNPDYLFHAGLNLPLQTSGEFHCPFTQRQRKKMDRFSPAQICLLNNLREAPRKALRLMKVLDSSVPYRKTCPEQAFRLPLESRLMLHRTSQAETA